MQTWSATHDAALGWASMEFVDASTMHFSYVLSESGKKLDSFTLTKKR